MDDSKPWWQSTTIWASVGVVVASLLGIFGFDTGQDPTLGTDIGSWASSAAAAVFGAFAIWRRIAATKRLSE